MLHNYVELYNNDSSSKAESSFITIENLSFYFMFGAGTFLALVRMVDPYYRHILKSTVREYFGFVTDEHDEGIIGKPLNSYLAESLNVELINIIL